MFDKAGHRYGWESGRSPIKDSAAIRDWNSILSSYSPVGRGEDSGGAVRLNLHWLQMRTSFPKQLRYERSIFDLPENLRGPPNNRWGGHNQTRLRTYGGLNKPRQPVKVFSRSEIAQWIAEHK